LLSKDHSLVASWLVQAEEVLPGLHAHLQDITVIDWNSCDMSRGGFSCWPAGHQMAVRPRLGQSHGRLHFAGEHTAAWSGFIEGALESAERVVEEITDV
jgi:monoamine oxidase